MSLKFDVLRAANTARLPQFKNKHGELAHSKADGSDWTPAQWLQAVVGELGEYANVRKKFERGDLTAEEFRVEAEKELADVQTYLDILAMRCLDYDRIIFVNQASGLKQAMMERVVHPTGVDLGKATITKFNQVSSRVKSTVRISVDGNHYRTDFQYE